MPRQLTETEQSVAEELFEEFRYACGNEREQMRREDVAFSDWFEDRAHWSFEPRASERSTYGMAA